MPSTSYNPPWIVCMPTDDAERLPRCRELEKLRKMVKKSKFHRNHLLLWCSGQVRTSPYTPWLGLASKSRRHEKRVVKMGGDVAAVTPVLRLCHIPVTRRNRYGNVTGNNLVTRARTRVTRTRKPARVLKPVPITSGKDRDGHWSEKGREG